MAHGSQGTGKQIGDTVEEKPLGNDGNTNQTRFQSCRILKEEQEKECTHEVVHTADGKTEEGGQRERVQQNLSDVSNLSCTIVLTGKGDIGLIDSTGADVDELLQGSGRTVAGDDQVTKGIDAGLNDDVAEGEKHVLDQGWQTDADD